MWSAKKPSSRGLFSLLLCCLVAITGCGKPGTGELTVFCAASLSATVDSLAKSEKVPIRLVSGGSHTLVRQVAAGAHADLLLLADDRLAKEKSLPRSYQLVPIASNELVLIASAQEHGEGTARSAEQTLEESDTLAVADPQTAPLGAYTEELLKNYDLTGKTIPLKDARAVLTAVALGHAPVGIVYRSDAMAEPKVRTVMSFPPEQHSPIRYVAALKPDAPKSAQILVDSLRQGRGRQEMEKAGFLPPPSEQ